MVSLANVFSRLRDRVDAARERSPGIPAFRQKPVSRLT
jgi:hypothetical protein